MDRFSGFEPQVGEIRALRTFRIGRDARLYPLFGTVAWTEGTNTARCRATATRRHVDPEHAVVDPNCTCGFYAYADEPAAAEYPHSRHVLAVVACWGRVVAGTRGLRSEHARVESIWMSPTVPADLAAQVVENYPATSAYDDRAEMLAAHPPTHLDCYELPSPRERTQSRFVTVAALLIALTLGVLPWHWLTSNHDAFALWAVALVTFVVATIAYGGRAEVAARKRALVCSAAVLWLIAPLAGPAGFYFFRLPVLQVAVVARRQRSNAIRASSRFPADIG
jgi:hypothetical protein